jgi:hypothetical protein
LKEERIPDSTYEKMLDHLQELQFRLKRELKEIQDEEGKTIITPDDENSQTFISLPKLTLSVTDSAWITNLIYEDVERGAYYSKITTTPASNCIELNIDLLWNLLIISPATVALGVVAKRSTNYLIDKITQRIESRLSPKSKSKRKKEKN